MFNVRELGIGIVPYSPLGRGFLVGGAKLVENLPDGDLRKVCACSSFFYMEAGTRILMELLSCS